MMMLVMVVMMGCNNGVLEEEKIGLEKKNSFLDSLVKIGEGFQEIFGVFGSAVGDALGFSVVKSGDTRSKIGEHFKKLGNGLTTTNNKLKELAVNISKTKNADGNTIEVVKGVIKGANDVFEQLIASLIKLADVTNDVAGIGDTVSAGAAVAADKDGVDSIVTEVKNIIELAEKSNIEVKPGNVGEAVNSAASSATSALTANGDAGVNAGPKLAAEVSKADPWAMLDKIKNAKANVVQLNNANNKGAGELAVGTPNHANGAGAATNADLAAAVALKAMVKSGKFSANAGAGEVEAVKAAAINAVNKVLGILDVIIRKTVSSNLDKVREAVKGIKYSETSGAEASQSDATQSVVTK
ncbi:variable large family protein [Borrelia hispanica]|uniref:variable large family protein n=1 Tax=Borrelia hispanica TaxID=40835 RepID=UPI000570AAE1|nr:variable large family protein [Borrelia hispanica]